MEKYFTLLPIEAIRITIKAVHVKEDWISDQNFNQVIREESEEL
jgi:hypothetical protein